MRPKISRSLVAVTAVLLAGGMVRVCAQGPGMGPKDGPMGELGPAQVERVEQFKKELDLSDEQMAKIRELRTARMEKTKAIHEELKPKMEALKALLEDYSASQSALDKAVTDIETVRGKMIRNRVAAVQEIKPVLTKEQFEKLNTLVSEKREERRENWKKNRPRK